MSDARGQAGPQDTSIQGCHTALVSRIGCKMGESGGAVPWTEISQSIGGYASRLAGVIRLQFQCHFVEGIWYTLPLPRNAK
jgi:hypothetical protein